MIFLSLRSIVVALLCCTLPEELAALNNDDLCAILLEHTPEGTEGCLANIAPEPSDGSFVFLTRNGSDIRALLLRADLGPGGDCRPSSGLFAGNLCVTFDYETSLDFAGICTDIPVETECERSTRSSRYADGNAVSATAVGGKNPAPSEPFFEAARGLEVGDVALQEVAGTLIYKGSSSADGRTLRLLRAGDQSPPIRVRPLVDDRAVLEQAVSAIDAKGYAFADIVAIGTEGRFVSRVAGTLIFHGTPDDCGGGGACAEREVLDDTAFDARLAAWSAAVAIETPSSDLSDLLIDRLLLGTAPYAPVDKALDTARVRQSPALLLLKWD